MNLFECSMNSSVGPMRNSRVTKTPTAKNAERERSRVRSLRNAFQSLQSCLPSVPRDTKLSKLDVLILATNYIAQLTHTLQDDVSEDTDSTAAPPTSESSLHFTSEPDFGIDSANSATLPAPLLYGTTVRCPKYYHPIKKWPMRSRLYSPVVDKPDRPQLQQSQVMEIRLDCNNNDDNNNKNNDHHHHSNNGQFDQCVPVQFGQGNVYIDQCH